MIPNIVNTVLGLVLVYAAVLKPSLVADQPINLLLASLVIIACALWARKTDSLRWFSLTNIVTGTIGGALAVAHWLASTSTLVTFWGVFWVGIVVSIVALWAMLYQPQDAMS